MNRREFMKTLATTGFAAGAAVAASHVRGPEKQGGSAAGKDIAERILDTRRLRCGYLIAAPYFTKDPNTGEMADFFFDLIKRLGELADFDIAWEAETTYTTLTEDLRRGKFDVFGAGLWPSVARAKAVHFSLPAFYSGVGIYVRHDDRRFDGDSARFNQPRYRIATIDGEMSQAIQQSDFPFASVLSLPDSTAFSMLAESVVTGKADAAFLGKEAAADYLRKKPGALRALELEQPLRVFETTWAFAYGSERLRNVIDTAVKDMTTSGFVNQVLVQHGLAGSFYRVRSPVA